MMATRSLAQADFRPRDWHKPGTKYLMARRVDLKHISHAAYIVHEHKVNGLLRASIFTSVQHKKFCIVCSIMQLWVSCKMEIVDCKPRFGAVGKECHG